jgi:hypothetical protein
MLVISKFKDRNFGKSTELTILDTRLIASSERRKQHNKCRTRLVSRPFGRLVAQQSHILILSGEFYVEKCDHSEQAQALNRRVLDSFADMLCCTTFLVLSGLAFFSFKENT